jgi:hypothetical protein
LTITAISSPHRAKEAGVDSFPKGDTEKGGWIPPAPGGASAGMVIDSFTEKINIRLLHENGKIFR